MSSKPVLFAFLAALLLLSAGCVTQKQVSTPSPAIEKEEIAATASPSTALPSATPSLVAVTPLPSATLVPTAEESPLEARQKALQGAANRFLEAFGATNKLSLIKLTYSVSGFTTVTRDYYEGEVKTDVFENGSAKDAKIKLRVVQAIKGEYEKGYQPSAERTVSGRLLQYEMLGNTYRFGLFCDAGKHYAYAEYTSTSQIPVDELFKELAKDCPE